MEIINDLTKDGALKIYQGTTLNTFTFDSILLANFVTINKRTKKVVDLCAGNAPIAMLLTRRKINKDIHIKSVELQEEVSNLGTKSIKLNGLDNVEMINDNLINISKKIGSNKYNLVTCNPPYFRVDTDSNINPNEKIALARHELAVNLEQIIIESKKLLDSSGTIALVFRPERLDDLIVLLEKNRFKVKRIQFVYPRLNDPCNTILVEAKKGQLRGQVTVEQPLIVYNDDYTYTKQAQEIINI